MEIQMEVQMKVQMEGALTEVDEYLLGLTILLRAKVHLWVVRYGSVSACGVLCGDLPRKALTHYSHVLACQLLQVHISRLLGIMGTEHMDHDYHPFFIQLLGKRALVTARTYYTRKNIVKFK